MPRTTLASFYAIGLGLQIDKYNDDAHKYIKTCSKMHQSEFRQLSPNFNQVYQLLFLTAKMRTYIVYLYLLLSALSEDTAAQASSPTIPYVTPLPTAVGNAGEITTYPICAVSHLAKIVNYATDMICPLSKLATTKPKHPSPLQLISPRKQIL